MRIGSKYRVSEKIGGGSFGEVFKGEITTTHEMVAIKLEPTTAVTPQIYQEAKVYSMLVGGVGIPDFKWHGTEGDYNGIVIELLGQSIEEMFCMCSRSFSLKTVLMIADQVLDRVQYMHEKGLIHRDIKPENFMLGLGQKSNQIYIIDFGLSKKYRDLKDHTHIPFREGRSLTGTARYTSLNTHIGIEQSRRDDIEGIAYMLIYLLKGCLPWQGLKAKTKSEKNDLIAQKKFATTIDALCEGIPAEFGVLLNEARRLDFSDRPDYPFYRKIFRDLFIKQGFSYDYNYDWVILSSSTPRSILSAGAGLKDSESDDFPSHIISKPQNLAKNDDLLLVPPRVYSTPNLIPPSNNERQNNTFRDQRVLSRKSRVRAYSKQIYGIPKKPTFGEDN